MREYLRRTCDEGWIIDLSPEGNRPETSTRIFGAGVGRQLSIGIFARSGHPKLSTPAVIHHATLAGTRNEKLVQLDDLHVDTRAWKTCQKGWQDPFLPASGGSWEECLSLPDLMPWASRGVTTGRTWIYAPDPSILRSRWQAFIAADIDVRKHLFHEARDRKITTHVEPLPGFPRFQDTLASETSDLIEPIQVGYRSFDRQWVIPDNRLMVVPRPPLWAVRSDRQVYVTEQNSHPVETGPGLTFTGLIPDIHHYNARSGRVFPLFRNPEGTIANFTPDLVPFLGRRLGCPISAVDLLAYIAGVVAHPGYTRRFHAELRQPGIRVPLTADFIIGKLCTPPRY
ncbi:MAG TPA: type ISP restriction/modification enzyme [Streptosporangiaceae bacterium]|nr:type ISP restriction/modification enzyme [Streptosporangiaceae bacterium]